MPSRLLAETISSGTARSHARAAVPVTAVCDLNALAVQSLGSLFDERQGLFCRRAELTTRGLRQEGPCRRRTIIALLGLQRLAESGTPLKFDSARIRDAVLADVSWVESAGDLGLLAWVAGMCAPDQLPRLCDEKTFDKALGAYADARARQTRGLACFLSGIAHARSARVQALPDLTDVAVEAYQLLLDNQRESGLFAEQRRSRLGTFADQMYAIYALTAFSREFDIEQPLEAALACANAVCAAQGDSGQWWSRYDTRKGRVANHYPVFSMHQDGIGPAALLSLQEATSQAFQPAVWKGLYWITGNNELGADLRGFDQGLIWDSIDLRLCVRRYWERAYSYVRATVPPEPNKLRIRYEARPDHYGWLLYAFGELGLSNRAISVATASG